MIEADTSYGETWAIGVGAVMYDAPNGAEIGRVAVAQRIEALGAPFVAGAVDYTWRMVRILTAAGPGDAMHRGVYVRRSQLTDPRPAEAPAPDCRAALAARDEEWRAWALAGSPGRE